MEAYAIQDLVRHFASHPPPPVSLLKLPLLRPLYGACDKAGNALLLINLDLWQRTWRLDNPESLRDIQWATWFVVKQLALDVIQTSPAATQVGLSIISDPSNVPDGVSIEDAHVVLVEFIKMTMPINLKNLYILKDAIPPESSLSFASSTSAIANKWFSTISALVSQSRFDSIMHSLGVHSCLVSREDLLDFVGAESLPMEYGGSFEFEFHAEWYQQVKSSQFFSSRVIELIELDELRLLDFYGLNTPTTPITPTKQSIVPRRTTSLRFVPPTQRQQQIQVQQQLPVYQPTDTLSDASDSIQMSSMESIELHEHELDRSENQILPTSTPNSTSKLSHPQQQQQRGKFKLQRLVNTDTASTSSSSSSSTNVNNGSTASHSDNNLLPSTFATTPETLAIVPLNNNDLSDTGDLAGDGEGDSSIDLNDLMNIMDQAILVQQQQAQQQPKPRVQVTESPQTIDLPSPSSSDQTAPPAPPPPPPPPQTKVSPSAVYQTSTTKPDVKIVRFKSAVRVHRYEVPPRETWAADVWWTDDDEIGVLEEWEEDLYNGGPGAVKTVGVDDDDDHGFGGDGKAAVAA
ncbi:UNVERIFIED_CONTAM: hypothetical protein HDU68_012679 [Siphonaria sp. JEL0065]|nr:hypothetical protein HDU68_012679 [Siphonaria sp. JEL0065]